MTSLQSRLQKSLAKYEADYRLWAEIIAKTTGPKARYKSSPEAIKTYEGWMEQIWVGMHSIKESLRLLETNAAEEDWDTRYWTWVDREILSEAAALAEETDQDVEPAAAQDPAGPAVEVPVSQDPGAALSVEADVHSGPGPGPALAAVAKLQSGPALAVEQADVRPVQDADDHALKVSGPALAAEAELHSGPALAAEAKLHSGPAVASEADLHSGAGHSFAADSDRALAALATQLTVPAIAAELTVPAAAVEAAPDPDHGLPVDRGPDDAGDSVPAPVLTSVEMESSGYEEDIRKLGAGHSVDNYADNVTVANNFKLREESNAPALEKFSLDEISVLKVKDHVTGMATKPPETPAFMSDPIVKNPAMYEQRGDVIEVETNLQGKVSTQYCAKADPQPNKRAKFIGNGCDPPTQTQYNSEAAPNGQYEQDTRTKKDNKFTEFNGKRKKRKKTNPRMNRIQGRKKTGRKKKKIRIRMMRIPWKRMKIQMFRISLDSKSDPNPVRRWQCHNMLPASILRKSSAATIMKFELLTVRITSSIQNSELPTCARFPSTNVNIFRRCMFRPPSSALNAGTPSNPRTASSPSANSSS